MTLYDVIGKTYTQTRKADPRIAEKLLEILTSSPVSTIADIGAGTGSYATVLADYGYRILAIEPSATMRDQAMSNPNIQWSEGFAENIPLSDKVVDAVIVMLAIHHFSNYRQALKEIHRIVGNGQIVFFTCDPFVASNFWLNEYFPSFTKDLNSTFLPLPKLVQEIKAIADSVVNVIPFSLPHDLSDSFAGVGWRRPELYLDGNIRSGISSFSKINDHELNSGLLRLGEDLESGRWDKKYGHLRQQSQYDIGYRFVHRLAL